jgi:hypothetical protein
MNRFCRLALVAALGSGCFEPIDHTPDSGAPDSGTPACVTASCPCAQRCGGPDGGCAPFTPSLCDGTTQCDHIVTGSSCTGVARLGSSCGYHACLLPDGGGE